LNAACGFFRTTLSGLLRDQVSWDLSCRSGFHLWPTHAIAVESFSVS
jgi:hypothetical protein